MPAQREPRADLPMVGRKAAGARAGSGSVLPWRPVSSPTGEQPADHAPGSRLGPARGILVGLFAGVLLWLLIGVVAWMVFRRV